MQGVSPVNKSLTSIQAQRSTAISEALPDFPSALSDLISQMATPNFDLAKQPLELNLAGQVVQNQSNQAIIACIELALTSPSSDCDPAIKAAIFVNATEQEPDSPTLKPYLIEILEGLTAKGQKINLDRVVLKDLAITANRTIDLTGMSARGATFNNVRFYIVKMNQSDLSEAIFINTRLLWADLSEADMTDATLTNVKFYSTEACALTCNQLAVFKCARSHEELETWARGHFKICRTFLYGENVTALPDSELLKLPTRYKF